MRHVHDYSNFKLLVFSLAGRQVLKGLAFVISIFFVTVAHAVHVGSGSHDFGTTSKPNVVSYSLDINARVYVENGYVMIQYLNQSTWSGTGAGQWPGSQWCYLTARATVNGTTINAVKFDFAYGTADRIFNAGKIAGRYIVYGDGKGFKNVIGLDYVLCTFNFSNGEITDLKYTEEPPDKIEEPKTKEWFNDGDGIMHIQGGILGYDENGKAVLGKADIYLEPGQKYVLDPNIWANQGIDPAKLKDAQVIWDVGNIPMSEWNKAKESGRTPNTNPIYDKGADGNWVARPPEEHDPRWYNSPPAGTPLPPNNSGSTIKVPDPIIKLPDNFDDLNQNQKDAIEKGVNDYNNGSMSNTGTSTGKDTVNNPDASNSDKLLSGILAENKKQTDALNNLDVSVDVDMSGVEKKLDEANQHLSEMKEQEKGFFEKFWDWATDKNGDGEDKANDRGSKENSAAEGRFNNVRGNLPNNFGNSNDLIQGGTVSTDGGTNDEWVAEIPGYGTLDFHPRRNLASWEWLGDWCRRIVMGVLAYMFLRRAFDRIREVLKMLMQTTQEQGNTAISIAPFGFGVTSFSVSSLIKLTLAITLFGGLAVALWAIYKGNPYYGNSFGLEGSPKMWYDCVSVFLPIEALVAFPLAVFFVEFSIFASGMVAGWLKKATSVI